MLKTIRVNEANKREEEEKRKFVNQVDEQDEQ